jgi:magnesium transporter
LPDFAGTYGDVAASTRARDRAGIRAYLFDAAAEDSDVVLERGVVERLGEDQLLWIEVDLNQADAIRDAAAVLGLNDRVLAGLLSDEAVEPTVVDHAEYLHLHVCEAVKTENGYEPRVLKCVLGAGWILTGHYGEVTFVQRFADHIAGDSELGRLNTRAFLAKLLDWHLSSYFRVVEAIEREVDVLDDRLLADTPCDRRAMLVLALLRRRVAELRRLLAPHREVYAILAHPKFAPIEGSDDADLFPLLNDRLARAIDAVENAREMLIGSYDIYMTQLSQRTNDVMKLLTVTSVLLLPPTMIAGILGMNFQPLPSIFHGTSHFWITILLMALLSTSVLVVAKARSWL